MTSWGDHNDGYDDAGKPEIAGEKAKQSIYYCVKGEVTSKDPIITSIVTGMCAALIDKSKRRYNSCVANGKKGGRPEKFSVDDMMYLQSQGLSQQEIADNLGCDIKTVQRKLDASNNKNGDDEI